MTEPAADVGHVDTGIESIHDAIERGEPLREQTRLHGSNMPDLLERLRLTLSDRYAIDREIGHGERHCRPTLSSERSRRASDPATATAGC